MPSIQYPKLPSEIFLPLYEYSLANLMLPSDAVRVTAGLAPSEPFLLTLTEILGRDEIDRFLAILSVLYKKGKRKFEEVAPSVRGRTRIYFGRTAKEVFSTGSSNTPKKIPGADWYVSTNNDGSRKAEIVKDLMTAMGFSWDYSFVVASLCYSRTPIMSYYYRTAYTIMKSKNG
jgi:hypothetical protein